MRIHQGPLLTLRFFRVQECEQSSENMDEQINGFHHEVCTTPFCKLLWMCKSDEVFWTLYQMTPISNDEVNATVSMW